MPKSIVERTAIENSELMQLAKSVVSLGDAVACAKEYGKLIGSKTQNVIKSRVFTCIQVYVLNKFIESKKFIDTVKEIGNSKRKSIFEINLYKLLIDFTAFRKSLNSLFLNITFV